MRRQRLKADMLEPLDKNRVAYEADQSHKRLGLPPLAADCCRFDLDMSDVTRAIEAMRQGDPQAADELLSLVYNELRRLAADKMAQEPPGQTLQPTALVHEAWLRLGADAQPPWVNRAHFFGAAAEAMRRILVERARRKQRLRHGGALERVSLDEVNLAIAVEDDKLLQVHEVLDELEREDPLQARVVKLRFFAGLSSSAVASALGVSERTVRRYWAHAKAWLYTHINTETVWEIRSPEIRGPK